MKRFAILLLVVCACAVVFAALPTVNTTAPPATGLTTADKTPFQRWYHARTITANDTALTASTRTWNYASSRFVALPDGLNSVTLTALGYGDGTGDGDPGSGSFSWTMYVCRQWGPPEIVATGTWAIGEMACSHSPASGIQVGSDAVLTSSQTNYGWGELPVISNDYWSGTVQESGTTDQLGALSFDPGGCWGVYIEVSSLSGLSGVYFFLTGR